MPSRRSTIALQVLALAALTTILGCSSSAKAPPTAAASAVPGFGDGLHLVGVDIQPGVYETDGDPAGCVDARLSGTNPSGLGDPHHPGPTAIHEFLGSTGPVRGHLAIELLAGDKSFFSYGCGEWRPISAAGSRTSFGDGVWVVGKDIQPGRYRGDNPDYKCTWARLDDLTFGVGHTSGLERSGLFIDDQHPVVEIQPTDAAFESQDCGTLEPVP